MKIQYLYILVLITTISCSINKYSHWHETANNPRIPKYPDYRLTNLDTCIGASLLYKIQDPSEPWYRLVKLDTNGYCYLSYAYDKDSLVVSNPAYAYQGKYQMRKDSLTTEFFIGGNPNSYFITTYKIAGDSIFFIRIGERIPNRSKIKYYKLMQDRYRENGYLIKNNLIK